VDLISEALHEGHVTSSFNCGVEALDRWLRESAGRGSAQDTGRTFVWHEGDGVVVAYYTLAGHVLHRDNLSRSQARSLPAEVPAILLAKLALDTGLHSQGLGAELLVEALTRCVQAGQLVASRYVVVDAINEAAAAFYRRYGFSDIPTPAPPTRLLRRLRDIAADLDD
jgi:ribosomal protein S18 acetylase RimI-like enzyme